MHITQLIADNYLFFTLILFVFGACVGSFLNVCIYRMPQEGVSIVFPGSHCPKCKAPVKWYDNIPILSFLILKAKCRSCKAPISPRYAFIEVITGFIFVQYSIFFGHGIEYFFYLYLTCSLIVVTLVDMKWQIIPDEINFSGMFVGVVLSTLFPIMHGQEKHLFGLLYSIVGLLVGGGAVFLIGMVGEMIFKREAMGGGDVKLMAMIGAFLGWKMALIVFFMIGPLLGSVIGLYVKYIKKEDIIPYGPFLSIGAIIAIFWGSYILSYLMGAY